jgi:hypothetical protein
MCIFLKEKNMGIRLARSQIIMGAILASTFTAVPPASSTEGPTREGASYPLPQAGAVVAPGHHSGSPKGPTFIAEPYAPLSFIQRFPIPKRFGLE